MFGGIILLHEHQSMNPHVTSEKVFFFSKIRNYPNVLVLLGWDQLPFRCRETVTAHAEWAESSTVNLGHTEVTQVIQQMLWNYLHKQRFSPKEYGSDIAHNIKSSRHYEFTVSMECADVSGYCQIWHNIDRECLGDILNSLPNSMS